jgi:hypothetical protein
MMNNNTKHHIHLEDVIEGIILTPCGHSQFTMIAQPTGVDTRNLGITAVVLT